MFQLTATTEGFDSRQWTLRAGQRVCVGRSVWATCCVPDDPHLAPEHFYLVADTPPRAEAAAGQSIGERPVQTWIAGSPDHRDQFVAGTTTFEVVWPAAAVQDVTPPEVSPAAPEPAPTDEIDRMIATGRFDDAVSVIADRLPPPAAVGWIMSCLPSADEAIRRAIVDWCDQPSARTRLAVAGCETENDAWVWLARAVAFTAPSLAADDQPVVPPPPGLPAVAIIAAVRFGKLMPNCPANFAEKLAVGGRELLKNQPPSLAEGSE